MKLPIIFTLSLLAVIYTCVAFIFIDNTATMFAGVYGDVFRTTGTVVSIFTPVYLIARHHDE